MMRYKLVIAEKPSVAQSLAAVIGATARKDGYLEGNGWRVSWCVGHLAGLADADSYDPKYAKWRYDDLPILPEHWQMVVGKDKKKQFDILKKLMNAPDVTEVVNACDGDVIDFTAKLFDLSPKEAAEKLAQDFGLIYDGQAPPRRRYVRQKNEAQKFREDRQHCYRVLSDYYYLLKKWEADRSPRTPEEEPHPRFVEAIQKKPYVEYLLDLFLYESEEEQKAWIAEHTAEITHLERRLKIMAENKPTNRERLREITDGIEQGIKELFESEKYMRYLSVMSRFHRYSVNNTMLIYMQKPDATLVAGYNKWKDQFERHVKKGEHGITIIAPTPYKKKIEEQKLDPDTKAPILDKDGKVVTDHYDFDKDTDRLTLQLCEVYDKLRSFLLALLCGCILRYTPEGQLK